MKTILVPINFSEVSLKAVASAVQVAKKMKNVSILLLHGLDDTAVISDIEAQFKTVLKTYQNTGIQLDTQIISGFSPSKIANIVAQNKEIGLVVMGTAGKNRGQFFFGNSNTSKVEELLTCPIMVVPQKADNKEFKHWIYALGFDKRDLEEIDRVLKFAELFNAKVECLRLVNQQDNEDVKLLQILKQAYDLPKYRDKIHFTSLTGNNLSKALEDYVKENQVDMTVLLTRQRSFLEKNFGNSLTQKLTLQAQIPLLVLNKDEIK